MNISGEANINNYYNPGEKNDANQKSSKDKSNTITVLDNSDLRLRMVAAMNKDRDVAIRFLRASNIPNQNFQSQMKMIYGKVKDKPKAFNDIAEMIIASKVSEDITNKIENILKNSEDKTEVSGSEETKQIGVCGLRNLEQIPDTEDACKGMDEQPEQKFLNKSESRQAEEGELFGEAAKQGTDSSILIRYLAEVSKARDEKCPHAFYHALHGYLESHSLFVFRSGDNIGEHIYASDKYLGYEEMPELMAKYQKCKILGELLENQKAVPEYMQEASITLKSGAKIPFIRNGIIIVRYTLRRNMGYSEHMVSVLRYLNNGIQQACADSSEDFKGVKLLSMTVRVERDYTASRTLNLTRDDVKGKMIFKAGVIEYERTMSDSGDQCRVGLEIVFPSHYELSLYLQRKDAGKDVSECFGKDGIAIKLLTDVHNFNEHFGFVKQIRNILINPQGCKEFDEKMISNLYEVKKEVYRVNRGQFEFRGSSDIFQPFVPPGASAPKCKPATTSL